MASVDSGERTVSRFARRTATALAATLLACCVVPAIAADPPISDQDTLQPRFAVRQPRLQAAPAGDSLDGRFQLNSRLHAAPGDGQHGTGIELHAKVINAAAAACNDVIFANGFQ
jgi:hypothetical protein